MSGQNRDRAGAFRQIQQASQLVGLEQRYPAHAQSFGTGREPQVLDSAGDRTQVHLRQRAPAQDIVFAAVGQRRNEQLAAFENAFELQAPDFVRSRTAGLGGRFAFALTCMDGAAAPGR